MGASCLTPEPGLAASPGTVACRSRDTQKEAGSKAVDSQGLAAIEGAQAQPGGLQRRGP